MSKNALAHHRSAHCGRSKVHLAYFRYRIHLTLGPVAQNKHLQFRCHIPARARRNNQTKEKTARNQTHIQSNRASYVEHSAPASYRKRKTRKDQITDSQIRRQPAKIESVVNHRRVSHSDGCPVSDRKRDCSLHTTRAGVKQLSRRQNRQPSRASAMPETTVTRQRA